MTQDEKDWIEDWFGELESSLAAIFLRQTFLQSEMHGLRDALFRLQKEPDLSPRQLLAQWEASASEALKRLEKPSRETLEDCRAEILGDLHRRRKARRKKGA